jgi:hypothetical protein
LASGFLAREEEKAGIEASARSRRPFANDAGVQQKALILLSQLTLRNET